MRCDVLDDVADVVRQSAPPHRSPGPLEGVTFRGDRATAPCEDICNRAFSALFHAERYTKAVRDGTVYFRTMSFDPIVETSSPLHVRCQPNRAWQNLQSADDGDKTNSSPGRAQH